MSEWREATLADICEDVSYGFTASASDDPELPRFLRITDIVPDAIDWRTVPGCAISPKDEVKHSLRPGDIVVARTGATVGYAKRIRQDVRAVAASYLVRFRPSEAVDAAFVGHVVESAAYKEFVKTNAGGAAQPNANAKVLGSYLLQLPDRPAQQRISAILDSIDHLIENNRRRIVVLEEMAQAIYREWFVHFRYPGHEDATFVDSPLGPIPEGWEVVNLGDVVELSYGKALKKENRLGGDVAVIGSSGIVGWHDSALVDGPSIVVGRKGNVGNVTWVSTASWPIDTTYFVRTELPLRYVAEQLKCAEFINSHAAVPGLSREQAYSVGFLSPPADTMHRFQIAADLLGEQTDALRHSADRLESVRDLLLPKLVTGGIDVSAIDLDSLVGAVS